MDFQKQADEILEQLLDMAEDADHDADIISGVLQIEAEDGREWVINKHAPTEQIWIASPISGATHIDIADSDKAIEMCQEEF